MTNKYNSTILVIDDDDDMHFLIERAFRKNGVTQPILTVHGGDEAIRYLMGEGIYANREKYAYPTFIMTDLKMPGADGFAVLEHIKGNPSYAVIPTVVFTSSNDPDDVKKSYALGANSYHIKPASAAELRGMLDIIHQYWLSCEVPQVDRDGKQVATASEGKLGERVKQVDSGLQRRVTE